MRSILGPHFREPNVLTKENNKSRRKKIEEIPSLKFKISKRENSLEEEKTGNCQEV